MASDLLMAVRTKVRQTLLRYPTRLRPKRLVMILGPRPCSGSRRWVATLTNSNSLY